MKFSWLLGLFVLKNVISVVAQDSTDVIYWTGNYLLNFDDFKGRPDSVAMFTDSTSNDFKGAALITKSILVSHEIIGRKTRFIIHAGMKRNSSWLKRESDTASLKHEQGHFDICEIYSRILRREMVKVKSIAEARKLYDQTSKNEEIEQDKFDAENTYDAGSITVEWIEKIKVRLIELEKFNAPEVWVDIYK